MFIKLKISSQRISSKNTDYLVNNSNVWAVYGQSCLNSLHGQSFMYDHALTLMYGQLCMASCVWAQCIDSHLILPFITVCINRQDCIYEQREK